MGANHSLITVNRKSKKHYRLFNRFFLGSKSFYSPTQLNTCLFNDNYSLKPKRQSCQPVPLQMSLPQTNQSILTRPIQCTIAIRRDSLKLIHYPNEFISIDFIFDADRPVQIFLYLMAHEQHSTSNGSLSYTCCRNSSNQNTFEQCYVFNRSAGYGQVFSDVPNDLRVPLSIFTDLHQNCSMKTPVYPIVIICRELNTEALKNSPRISNTNITPTFDQFHIILATTRLISSDSRLSITLLNQKHVYHGIVFQLFELYGMEHTDDHQMSTSSDSDSSLSSLHRSTCVICLSDLRNVLLLPCRHLCLCHSCAENLKFQSSNCPICRIPFRALLQMNVLHYPRRNSLTDADDDRAEKEYHRSIR